VNADNYIKARLATFCIEECGKDGDTANMLAIAFVLRNRVEAGWHGGDWLRVIEDAPKQRGNIPPPLVGLSLRDYNIKEFLRQIDDVYSGAAENDLTDTDDTHALYYAVLHTLTDEWFISNIARNHSSHPKIATVGLTSFFG
jgi:hypothetical protein